MQVANFGFVNIYKSGVFHRRGKPRAYDRHPGDIYPTQKAAEADIDWDAGYVATAPIQWYEDKAVDPNPESSEPIPLAVTRRPYNEKLARQREFHTNFGASH